MGRLQDRIILITGAAGGIGQAMAELFANEGADVVICDLEETSAQAAAEAIRQAGGSATGYRADVTELDDVKALMERVGADKGRLDCLINNAGVATRVSFRNVTDEQWQRVTAVNVDGTMRCSREAIELLRRSENASIINLASIMASRNTIHTTPYAASKGAVAALSRAMSIELAPLGIRVNYLCPGFIETRMIDPFTRNPQIRKHVVNHTPLRRLGTAEDVARAALFLASDDARFITGEGLSTGPETISFD